MPRTSRSRRRCRYKRRALRVFRDDTSLSATPHLWPTIEQALEQSRFLIVLASPEAAASPWVGKEIAYWLEHKSVDTLLVALTDGTVTWDHAAGDFEWSTATPLPAVLKGRFAAEPKWVDLCAYRTGTVPRDTRFTELAADFAAAVRGIPKEDLLSEEVRQQRRALRLAWSAATSLLVLAVMAGWQWQVARTQRERAVSALTTAAATSDHLLYDLALELRNRPGMPVDLVLTILKRVEAMQRQLAETGETTPELRRLAANALAELATTLAAQGDPTGALAAAERGRVIMEALLAADPGNPGRQRDLAVSINNVGDAKVAVGQLDQALDAFRQVLAIVEKLAAADPGNIELQRDLTIGLTRIGAILAVTGKRAEALVSFRRAAVILEGLAAREPDKLLWQADLGASYSRIGMALADSAGATSSTPTSGSAVCCRSWASASKPKRPIAARSTRSTGSPPPIPATRDGRTTCLSATIMSATCWCSPGAARRRWRIFARRWRSANGSSSSIRTIPSGNSGLRRATTRSARC
jgi:tetratricopeptide (TPR) repeat protein